MRTFALLALAGYALTTVTSTVICNVCMLSEAGADGVWCNTDASCYDEEPSSGTCSDDTFTTFDTVGATCNIGAAALEETDIEISDDTVTDRDVAMTLACSTAMVEDDTAEVAIECTYKKDGCSVWGTDPSSTGFVDYYAGMPDGAYPMALTLATSYGIWLEDADDELIDGTARIYIAATGGAIAVDEWLVTYNSALTMTATATAAVALLIC
jgi:hypothetical protein